MTNKKKKYNENGSLAPAKNAADALWAISVVQKQFTDFPLSKVPKKRTAKK
jgi:hypothetical protein